MFDLEESVDIVILWPAVDIYGIVTCSTNDAQGLCVLSYEKVSYGS
jgi:hypothetical protein